MSLTASGPSAADAALHLVAARLLDDLVAGSLAPSIVQVRDPAGTGTVPQRPDGVEVGVLALGDRHPTDLLLGLTAPAEWAAIGVASSGWAYPIGARGGGEARRDRVHLVTLVARSGEVAHRVASHTHPALADPLGTPGGEQIDLLHRALDLPTDPPPADAGVYWAIEWLSGILALQDPTWDDVVAAHPANRVLRGRAEVEIVTAARAFAGVACWHEVRAMVDDGRLALPDLSPGDGRWLDDGAVARFVLSRCPPLADLLDAVRGHLSPLDAARVASVLSQLDVPRATWPDDLGAPGPRRPAS